MEPEPQQKQEQLVPDPSQEEEELAASLSLLALDDDAAAILASGFLVQSPLEAASRALQHNSAEQYQRDHDALQQRLAKLQEEDTSLMPHLNNSGLPRELSASADAEQANTADGDERSRELAEERAAQLAARVRAILGAVSPEAARADLDILRASAETGDLPGEEGQGPQELNGP